MSKPTVTEGLKRTAVICILQHADQFLLLKRFKEPNKDLYTPVGGKLDPFETPLQAALRETAEETGFEIAAHQMHFAGILVETSPSAYNWTSFVYHAVVPFQPAPHCNEGTLEWISNSDLASLPTPPTDWHIYQYLQQQQYFVLMANYDDALNMVELREELTQTVLL